MNGEKIFIEQKQSEITPEQLREISEFYGGKSVDEIQKDYGLSPEQLLSSMRGTQAADERRKREEVENQRRQEEFDRETEAERERRRTRFENILRHRFFEANESVGANEFDFQRLLPKLIDNEMLKNYEKSVAVDDAEFNRSAELIS